MTANKTPERQTDTHRPRANKALWTAQVLLAVFFLVAAAGPKLAGEATAVEIFDDIGAGTWFRYLVGGLELLGAVGLLIRRLSGLAALGLGGIMIGAAITQVFILDDPTLAITPTILLVVFVLIARGRRVETRALLEGLGGGRRPAGSQSDRKPATAG